MQTTVITPPGRLNLPRWREMWASREVLYRFAQRDLILRYRQTALGVAWVIIQPLAAAGIFSIVFGEVANLSSGDVPYIVFSLAGMLAWTLFSGIATRSASSLVGNQALVSKVFFPRLLVPLSTVFSVAVDFLVGLALAVVLLFVFGINPGWAVLTLPVWAVLAALLGAGIGIAASALMVRYRDVGYVLPWLFQILLYASPVAYALSEVPARLQPLFAANPITWVLETFRWSLLGTPAPPGWQMIALAVVAPVVFLGGVLVFQALEREFADVI
ncbi:ABC transporter permease [Cellulosimicrobium marinum]|uniref:ABC transporter permease n=1 Tax=Cellulosimicrobium marinum TaxID=1638992 RepID=UPI001E284BE5|nr:ABC transporter permease [Cellulosimicrobium marinum]MCB7137048.1 ABC transporter permease [Cellulosimicrobium marinum]